MLSLFGLTRDHKPQYLPVDEVATFLREIGESESETGDWVRLDVPLGYERAYQAGENPEGEPLIDEDVLMSESFAVWRGSSRAELREVGVMRRPTAVELAREQRLARLADLALEIAERTGCSRAEAVCYLLCDIAPQLPYIQIVRSRTHGGLVLYVRDTRVSARDVAKAYAAWDSVYWPHGRKPRTPRHDVDIVKFVESRRPAMSWDDTWAEFDRAHPGLYADLKSFRNIYYELRKR
jgi:hypothetical protein